MALIVFAAMMPGVLALTASARAGSCVPDIRFAHDYRRWLSHWFSQYSP
jgi:hypothetical protein